MSERILIIRLGALGDLVLCSDAFASVRAAYPQAKIALLTGDKFVRFTKPMPWFDDVLPDPRPKVGDFAGWHALGRRLRGFAPDRVLDLHGKLRSDMYRRLFTRGTVDWHSCKAYKPDHKHMADWISALLSACAVPRVTADWGWLAGDIAAYRPPGPFVVFVAGSAPQHPQKRWPATHYAALARILSGQGITPVLVGTQAEAQVLADIHAAAPGSMNLCGRTDFAQLGSLMRAALGTIGNDTGPTHLAAKIGPPTLMLMGGYTDPARSHPRGPRANFLRVEDLANLQADAVWSRFQKL